MVPANIELNNDIDAITVKEASAAALASLLNLTFLPALAFIWLLIKSKQATNEIAQYHFNFAIKLNLIAAFALIVASGLMIAFGGFDSAWTWVYVITYFTFAHTTFIVIAVWALTKAWSGTTL